jgi:hypothetical protein
MTAKMIENEQPIYKKFYIVDGDRTRLINRFWNPIIVTPTDKRNDIGSIECIDQLGNRLSVFPSSLVEI